MATIRTEIVFDTKTGQASLRSLGGDLQELEKKGKSTGGAMTAVFQGVGQAVGQALFKAFSSATDWIGNAASAAIKWADSIGLSGDKMGTTAEAAQKLKHIAEQMDVPFGALEKAMGKMQVNLQKAPDAFTRLGLSMDALKRMTPEEQLAAVADKLSAIEDPGLRATAATAVFGKGWMDLAPLLKSGGDAVRELAEEAERLGLVMDGSVIAAGRDMDDTLTKLTEVWDGLIRNFGAAIVTSEPLHRLLEGLVEILGSFSKGVQDGHSDLQSFVDGAVMLAANALVGLVKAISVAVDMWTVFKIAVLAANTGIEQSIIWAKASAEALMHPTRALEIFKKAQEEHRAATQRGIAEAQREIQINTDRQNKIASLEVEVQKLAKNVTDADGIVRGASETNKKHGQSLKYVSEESEKAAAAAQKLKDEWDKVHFQTMQIGAKAAEKALDDLEAGASRAAKKIAEDFLAAKKAEEEMMAAMQGFAKKMDEADAQRAAERFGASFKVGFKSAVAGLPQVILDAVTGGGDVGKAIGTHLGGEIGKSLETPLKNALSGVLGKTIGGAFSTLAPGVGALLGSLGGKLLGGLFGNGEHKKVNDLRDAFVAAAGGITELDKKAQAAGLTVDKLLQAKKVSDYEKAVKELTDAFELQSEAHEKTVEAAERYGLTIEELGPKFKQQELDKMAGQLYQDFQLLKASGADMVAVMDKMGGATSEWLNTALQAGGEIPIAMKPMLLDMARAGSLIKANGEAYTEAEIEGLSYAQTMSEMFRELVQSVGDLVAALTGIPNIRRTVTIDGVDGGGGGDSVADTGSGGHRGRRDRDEGQAVGFYNPSLPYDMSFMAHRGEEVTVRRASDSPGQGRQPGGGQVDLSAKSVRDLTRALRDAWQLTGT